MNVRCRDLFRRFVAAKDRDGWRYATARTMRFLLEPIDLAIRYVVSRFLLPQTFICEGEFCRYHWEPGSRVGLRSERVVEIGLAGAFLRKHGCDRVLEVGNVMRLYVPSTHQVVDKYDTDPYVENRDAVDLPTADKYGAIVSISTIEHIGFDFGEVPQPEKALLAIAHLRKCLLPHGELLITVPLDYNPHIDQSVRDGIAGTTSAGFMRKSPWLGLWAQVEKDEALQCPYDHRIPSARAIAVLRFGADAESSAV